LLLVFAQLQSMPAAMACLMVVGFAQSLAMISIAVIPDAHRERTFSAAG